MQLTCSHDIDSLKPTAILLCSSIYDITRRARVGIGYAARQLRDRFLTTLHSAYYIKPLEESAIYRCYPGQWQVWLEQHDNYTLLA